MDKQFKHRILPEANHDELARQNFVRSLKTHLAKNMSPGIQTLYETEVKPRFEKEHQHPPQNRHQIRTEMEQQPYYQWVSALKRTVQEMLWDSVNTNVERQLPELLEKTKEKTTKLGSLTINPDLSIPSYQKAVDIHCMPGSYYSESGEDDIAAGALYDRGVYLYGMGFLGPLNDDLGQSAIQNFLKLEYPDLKPKKILDMGCSVGHSTLPYVDSYPEAEVYGIDVAAPMVRYGHARAEALGKRVYFSQQNAERTNFTEGSFDLVVSHILLHEMPVPAIRKVLQECYRLLSPGGMMVHVEAPLYSHMDAYRAFIFDWETANNNEPFWSAMRDLDLESVAIESGFDPKQIIQKFIDNGVWKQKESTPNGKSYGFGSRGNWFIFAAIK